LSLIMCSVIEGPGLPSS